jgi:uncharacterized membrane protein YphA (DoxX/SURF4 family)
MTSSLQLLLGGLLLLAGAGKLQRREAFQTDLRAIGIARSAGAVAIAVPCTELAVGGLVLSGLSPRLGAVLAAALLAAFSIVLLRMVRVNPGQRCGCFGSLHLNSTPELGLVRNFLLLAAAVVVIVIPGEGLWREGTEHVLGGATIALGASCLWSLVAALLMVSRAPRMRS